MIEGLAIFGWGVMLGYVLAKRQKPDSHQHILGDRILKMAREISFDRKIIGAGFTSTATAKITEGGTELATIIISSELDPAPPEAA